ncbi:hypothetical protein D1871_01370 [Nakamurella silvestris]|nr:hypothetical protein D1871_01370 [Nakamurella silvestris]
MRVSADTDLLDLAPGDAADITLDIVNNGQVIEGVTARVIGLPIQHVTSRPIMLPLFPDATGQMTLNIGLPTSFPAGRHPLTVEVHSRDVRVAPTYVDLDLVVPRVPAVRLSPKPQTVRARRNARFVLTLVNDGNTPLDVTLQGADADRAVDVRFLPDHSRVPAGTSVDVEVAVKGPRMMLGTDLDRTITVTATARPLTSEPVGLPGVGPAEGPSPSAPEAPTRFRRGKPVLPDPILPDPAVVGPVDPELSDVPADETVVTTTVLTYRQRPWFTRGILTSLILLAIVALWAAVFLFGISSVFSKDPYTKTVPASFYPVQVAEAGAVASAGATAPGVSGSAAPQSGEAAAGSPGGSGSDPAAAAVAPPPAGSMPKDGAMPAGLGGTLSGTVTAASNKAPVGRILVEALRQVRGGSWVVSASAATQADGTYSIAGLIPTTYAVRFSADGFAPVFYAGGTTVDTATPATATAGSVTPGIDVVIKGKPATITGSIDPGDTLDAVVATVTVRPLQGSGTGNPIATTKTKADGSYTLKKLPAPGTYELTFTAKGYLATTSTVSVDGGAQRINPEVLLGSNVAAIGGVVTDGTEPIGGVTVTTTVDGKELKTGTPTTGEVGKFILGDLPTPATYVLTFTADGFATSTMVVDLAPGTNQTDLKVALTGGTGTVTGKLSDVSGAGLGGAVVTVGGAENAPSTITLTAGDIGTFQLTGLVSPGSYTLTFTLPGYADQTVPVVLEVDKPPAPIAVVMATSLGEITGVVTGTDGKPLIGASVVASDGKQLYPVFSTAAIGGSPSGGYTIAQLPAGVYTVTASRTVAAGTAVTGVTAVITVTPGSVPKQNFVLPPASDLPANTVTSTTGTGG